MKKIMIRFAAAVLSAVMLFSGAPTQVIDSARNVASVQAAIPQPTNVKLSIKRIDSSQVEATASWNGSSRGYEFDLYYENGYGGSGKVSGVQYESTITYTFDHPEGEIRTYGIRVRGLESNDGPYSAEVKKTKSFMNTGKYTKKIKSIVKKNTSGMSDFEKVRFAHDWLVKNVDYDQNLDMEVSATLEGLMKNKKAVCQGYSIAFSVFMKQMGIPVKYAPSSNGDHMWNMVKLGKKWYHVDVTWDDPVGMESVTKKHPTYDYFLQSSKNFLAKSSSPDHRFSKSALPKADSTTYDNDGSKNGYSEPDPDDSRLMWSSTFSPWKNGKRMD